QTCALPISESEIRSSFCRLLRAHFFQAVPHLRRYCFQVTELASVSQPLTAVDSDHLAVYESRVIRQKVSREVGDFLMMSNPLKRDSVCGIELFCKFAGQQPRPCPLGRERSWCNCIRAYIIASPLYCE